jgi:hypothetical protein
MAVSSGSQIVHQAAITCKLQCGPSPSSALIEASTSVKA